MKDSSTAVAVSAGTGSAPAQQHTPTPYVPVVKGPCSHCGGEGKLYTSRYGGNDPDVWPTGDCPICEGSGLCEHEWEAEDDKGWRCLICGAVT